MHPAEIDFDPLRNTVVEQGRLIAACVLGRLSDAETTRFVHLAEISDGSMPPAARGPVRFHQNPVVVRLSVLVPADLPEEHNSI